MINGTINDTITDLEVSVLSWLKDNPHLTVADLVEKSGKSSRTVNRVIASLKNKGLVWRVGSNKPDTGEYNDSLQSMTHEVTSLHGLI